MAFRVLPGLLLCALLLPACSMFDSAQTQAMRKTPEYKAGYSDGCATGGRSGAASNSGTVRDDQAYNSIPAYRLGWNTGRQMCRSSSAGPTGASPFPGEVTP